MLQVNNLTIQFGDRYLFKKISFQVNEKERIGLAGRNGAGKSTLLKCIMGLQPPHEGRIIKPKSYTIGYLKQELDTASEEDIFTETSKAFSKVNELKAKIDELTEKITNHDDFESDEYGEWIEELGVVSHHYEVMDADKADKQIEQVLTGLGFEQKDFWKPVKELSGGWQMRIELAKILLQKPDLLLLDEPTNHLDIESIVWLEQFLQDYPGSVMMVTHDKSMLDNLTTRTIEIELGNLYDYASNYSGYILQRQQRREKLEAEKRNQDKYIEHTQQLINKFRAKKNKATFAQTLIKKLEKLEKIEIDTEDINSMHLRFPAPPRSGRIAVKCNGLTKRYGNNLVFDRMNFEIGRGEKVAFVGKNGEGKTTFSKIIAGQETYDGELTIGHNVKINYFAQHQSEMLDPNATVLDTVDVRATGEMRAKVRGLLGAFLFSGDDVYKKVKVLSGGEKARLSLACLLLEPANLAVFDEPTNHLDMISKAVLKEAFKHFSGTLIIVSHDRDFLNGLTDKVIEFRDKNIKTYLGGINYFLSKKKMDNMAMLSKRSGQSKNNEVKGASDNKNTYLAKKEKEKQIRRLKNKISQAEKQIAKLEKQISEFELQINDPSFYDQAKDPGATFQQYDQLKNQLKSEMESWEILAVDLEKVEE
jgi:ATP-binding cassette, subfamily F, member 3